MGRDSGLPLQYGTPVQAAQRGMGVWHSAGDEAFGKIQDIKYIWRENYP